MTGLSQRARMGAATPSSGLPAEAPRSWPCRIADFWTLRLAVGDAATTFMSLGMLSSAICPWQKAREAVEPSFPPQSAHRSCRPGQRRRLRCHRRADQRGGNQCRDGLCETRMIPLPVGDGRDRRGALRPDGAATVSSAHDFTLGLLQS